MPTAVKMSYVDHHWKSTYWQQSSEIINPYLGTFFCKNIICAKVGMVIGKATYLKYNTTKFKLIFTLVNLTSTTMLWIFLNCVLEN